MTKKFFEKNVINALHTATAKKYKTGVFADDIVDLKKFVQSVTEQQFGTLELRKMQKIPFHNATTRKSYSLFYPMTIEDFFGDDYINYEEAYDALEPIESITYNDLLTFVKPKKNTLKKYLFSGNYIITDWTDGEHYAFNYEGRDTYGKDHGIKGSAALLITAPNKNVAKFCAWFWFNCINGYHQKGCNYGGFGWVHSKDYTKTRYFGEFPLDLDFKNIVASIKLFDTKSAYNLCSKVYDISVKDIFSDRNNSYKLKNVLKLIDMYDFELDEVCTGKYKRDSLKNKVLKENLKYGIYASEVDSLYKNFDKTIELIRESEKRFDNFKIKDDLAKFLDETADIKKYELVRAPVGLDKGKDTNTDVLAANFYISPTEKFTFKNGDYCSFFSRAMFIITNKDVSFDSLKNCLALADSRRNYEITACHKVKELSSHLAICSYWKNEHTYKDEVDKYNLKYLKDVVSFSEVVPGIKYNELLDLEEDSFTNLEGISKTSLLKEPFEIKEITKDKHKCIALNTYIKVYKTDYNGRQKVPNFTFHYYQKLVNNMSKFGYHLITGENFSVSHKEYDEWEKVTLIFAPNKKDKDYSTTLQKDYWNYQVSRKFEEPMW